MINGRGGRILPILAAVLLFVALAVTLTILLLRIPDGRKFDETILSAEFALSQGSHAVLKRELLRASRHAVSAENWRTVLRITASAIPADAKPSDYRLFTVLAGRASSSIPGNGDFPAYWVWGLMRGGDTGKAADKIEFINSNDWSSIRAEVRLNSAVGDSEESLQSFFEGIENRPDPEFLENAAMLTESAELTFDAALLYMETGNPQKAYDLASMLMQENSTRRWANEETFARRGVAGALAGIAQDAGEKSDAIRWLSLRIDETNRRRVSSWESLQFLGDLYWEQYLLQGKDEYREKAYGVWQEAINLVVVDSENTELPGEAWRLWVNKSVLEQSYGNYRLSEETLNEALVLFPDRNEVRAAWARELADSEPALARRLVRTSLAETDDPVLGITAMQVDPEAVTPRLYEARLWELYETVTSETSQIQSVDGRILTTFLLDYMTSRKNLTSLDVAIDRYMKSFPDEKWILSWRMAADAGRGIAVIDLLAAEPGGVSPYEDFRNLAHSENSWRALHDSALFAMQASDELKEIAGSYPFPAGEEDSVLMESAIMRILESMTSQTHISDTPMEDRIDRLTKSRGDLEKALKQLSSSGRKGGIAGSKAARSLVSESSVLLTNALEDLSAIDNSKIGLSEEDLSSLLYLEALILYKSGRREDSVGKARAAIVVNPENSRARELLLKEVSS